DIIIALGMAKEGFDWPWCEHVLTVGYRSSLTEIVQIIGRATRDCEGKEHAQFTNLIAQPDAANEDVTNSVNNMLKAITVSLLMEQILAPNINFKPRSLLKNGEEVPPGTIIIDDTGKHKVSKAVAEILTNGGLANVTTTVLQDINAVGRIITKAINDREFTELELPGIVQQRFPSLEDEDVKTIAKFVELQMKIHAAGGQIDGTGQLVDSDGKIVIEIPTDESTKPNPSQTS
ncbi:DEAD-like helicase, partial [gut metagenome]